MTIPNFSRRRVALVAGLLLLASAACRGRHNRNSVQNEETPAPAAAPASAPDAAAVQLVSVLKMNDPAAPQQLVKGFYGLENGLWRWTAQSFSALLRTPAGAAQKGAVLSFSISVPDVVSQKLSAVTLAASINGAKLKSETYSKPGAYTFSADVPAALLAGAGITVDFQLDKALPPTAQDHRDLGVIATSVGLESK